MSTTAHIRPRLQTDPAARPRVEAGETHPFAVEDRVDLTLLRLDLPAEALAGRLDPRLTIDPDPRDPARAVLRVLAYRVGQVRSGIEGRLTPRLASPWVGTAVVEVGLCVRHAETPAVLQLVRICDAATETAAGDRWFGLPHRFGRVGLDLDACAGLVRGSVGLAAPAPAAEPVPPPPGARSAARALEFVARLGPALAPPHDADADWAADDFLSDRPETCTLERGLLRLRRVCVVAPPAWSGLSFDLRRRDLLDALGPAFAAATPGGGLVAPDVTETWIGRPRCMQGPACARAWPMEPA